MTRVGLSARPVVPGDPAVVPAARVTALSMVDDTRVRGVVVHPQETMRDVCARILHLQGFTVIPCSSLAAALECVGARLVDLLIVGDSIAPTGVGRFLEAGASGPGRPAVVVLAENPSVEASIAAFREGAVGYLPVPFAACHLELLAGRVAYSRSLGAESDGNGIRGRRFTRTSVQAPLGFAPALRRALELARRVASTDAPVFITGESGSGKETIAHLIHSSGRRACHAFVPINCAALPEGLLESELFGHRKGAFTDAVRDKPGLFEAAHAGTLLLDEVLEATPRLQAMLLRVIQDGAVRRVGSETADAVVNVRLIAATNGDPEDAVATSRLRADLYYRLRVVPIHVPSLRERREDIPLLVNHFLSRAWRQHRLADGPPPRLSTAAMRMLITHPWPGNVRELQNVIEHVAVLAEPGRLVGATDLSLDPAAPQLTSTQARRSVRPRADDARTADTYHVVRDEVIARFEQGYVANLLRRASGNMREAARIAGVPRSTLYRMMGRHGFERVPLLTQPCHSS